MKSGFCFTFCRTAEVLWCSSSKMVISICLPMQIQVTMMDIRGQPSSAWSADWRYGNITWTAAVSINSPMPSGYEDQIFHWLPFQFTSCYEDPSISLATPPVSSSPVQKYNPAHSFMQTLISSSQTFWEGGWGEGGGSNKIKQHVSCDQTTKNIQAGQHNLHQTLNILFTLAMK